jgi:hypothetical protein
MIFNGRIPEKLIIFFSTKLNYCLNSSTEYETSNAIVADYSDPITIKHAKNKASVLWKEFNSTIIDNTPTKLEIVKTDYSFHRSNRINVIMHGYQVSMRTQSLLEILQNNKTLSLDNNFIFIKQGNELNPISCESNDYKNILSKKFSCKNNKFLSQKFFKPGHVYLDQADRQYLFIDHINTSQLIYPTFSLSNFNKKNIIGLSERKKITNECLFYYTPQHYVDDVNTYISVNNFHIKNRMQIIEDIYSVKLSETIIQDLRDKAIQIAVAEISANRNTYSMLQAITSPFLNIHAVGQQCPEEFDHKLYDLYS